MATNSTLRHMLTNCHLKSVPSTIEIDQRLQRQNLLGQSAMKDIGIGEQFSITDSCLPQMVDEITTSQDVSEESQNWLPVGDIWANSCFNMSEDMLCNQSDLNLPTINVDELTDDVFPTGQETICNWNSESSQDNSFMQQENINPAEVGNLRGTWQMSANCPLPLSDVSGYGAAVAVSSSSLQGFQTSLSYGMKQQNPGIYSAPLQGVTFYITNGAQQAEMIPQHVYNPQSSCNYETDSSIAASPQSCNLSCHYESTSTQPPQIVIRQGSSYTDYPSGILQNNLNGQNSWELPSPCQSDSQVTYRSLNPVMTHSPHTISNERRYSVQEGTAHREDYPNKQVHSPFSDAPQLVQQMSRSSSYSSLAVTNSVCSPGNLYLQNQGGASADRQTSIDGYMLSPHTPHSQCEAVYGGQADRKQNTEQLLKSCGLYEPTILTAKLVKRSREIDSELEDLRAQIELLSSAALAS